MNTTRNKQILDLYNSGLSSKKVGENFGLSQRRTNTILHEMNAHIRHSSEYEMNKKHTCDENYFNTIDSEHKAYWLGLLYADGCVNSNSNCVSLGLKNTDDEIILKFLNDLRATQPISKYKNMSKINFYNRKLKTDLIKQGCVPNKSLKLIFPNENQLPKYLTNHFIRGYYDGDGCISYKNKEHTVYAISILGTKEFLFSIQEKLNLRKTKITPKSKIGSNNYCLQYGGNIVVKNILDEIYKNSSIYLKRKYDRYIELCNIYNSMYF